MLDYIACIIVRLLNLISYLAPISVWLWLGRRAGALVFMVNKKRRMIAYANLKAAFGSEKSPRELRSLTKRVYQNMAQTFIEILNLTKVNKKYIDRYVKIDHFERIKDAAKSGRGTILLTAHFGDWELSSLTSAMVGFPILVLAREQKMKRLNELLNRLRESKGCKVIRKGMSTKNILKALYGKNIVGILSDQDAGRKGIFVDFFGRPTSTHAGPAEMAKRTGSIILPTLIVREKGPYHRIFLEEYIDFRQSKETDDIKESLQKFADILESYIRKYPDQWLWLHKRWKSTPTRSVLVLNDGKAGHLNQALAVARQIQKARTTQGYAIDDTKIVVVDIKYKNRFSRTLLSLCAGFSSWRCHGCMRCMRLCLEENTYKTLMKTYSEFVVSAGSAATPVNVFMAVENNAKNVVIMKPDIINGLKKFSLALIPSHDLPAKVANVVSTTLAPNLVDEENLKLYGERLKARLGLDGGKFVGLLIGGDNDEFYLSTEEINKAISGMLKFCKENDARILATTSRRTPKAVDEAVKHELGNDPLCKLLVVANEENFEGAVAGILSLSSTVIVTGESISMVSEAVSSNKKVIALELARRKEVLTKHDRALGFLKREGYIVLSGASDLHETMKAVSCFEKPEKELRDRDIILEAVRRLI